MAIYESFEIRRRNEVTNDPLGERVILMDQNGITMGEGASITNAEGMMVHPQNFINVALDSLVIDRVVHTVGGGVWRVECAYLAVNGTADSGATIDLVIIPAGQTLAEGTTILTQPALLDAEGVTHLETTNPILAERDSLAAKVNGNFTSLSGNMTITIERVR